MIFPEGITTNNEGIVDFKRGAFDIGAPVKLMSFKYPITYGFHPNSNMMPMQDLLTAMTTQLWQNAELTEVEGCFYPKKFTDWNEYAAEAKQLMCKELGFKDFTGRMRDQIQFDKDVTPFKMKY